MGHPQGISAWHVTWWLVAALVAWLWGAGPARAQSGTPPNATLAAARHRNETLLGAAAPLVDFVRFAEHNDAEGMDQCIASLRAQLGQVAPALNPGARRHFEARLDALQRARRQADLPAAAMAAVEAYRTLILSLDASALTIPVQVDELGYASLKAELLTDGRATPWTDLARLAADAHRDWERIRRDVHNDALRHLMQVALTSLSRAAKARNAPMAYCAARFTGAAVELLRQQYLLWRH